jgi:outer membrane protein OmpA-like peptidoglycan-associated protein
MSHPISNTAVAAGIAMLVGLPVQAADNVVVDGYARSSSGETWTSSSGECVRTSYKDTDELLESCGYKRVVTEGVAVDNQPAGAGVAVVEQTQVVKDGEVLASSQAIVAETFIENLKFAFNSADLTASDKAELDGVIIKLDAHRALLRDNVEYLNVIGYTDSSGPEAYNLKLSERRAQAVANYFETQGKVRRQVMKVMGRGEADPIGDNSTEAGRQLNRRVVIEVVKY